MFATSDTESIESSNMDIQNDMNRSLPSIQRPSMKTNDSTILNIEKESPIEIFQNASRLEMYTWLEGKNLGQF